ncbi:hypothetical protein AOLI_G00242420 [Acnodon oligacanthus]
MPRHRAALMPPSPSPTPLHKRSLSTEDSGRLQRKLWLKLWGRGKDELRESGTSTLWRDLCIGPSSDRFCFPFPITSLFLSSIMVLLAPVLLLLALSGCSSEVVNSFTQTCPQFFAKPGGTLSPPTVFKGNNYKQICQVLENTYEYATLYDTTNRIPVYSAYKFNGLMQCTRLNNWYIEPQLEQITNSKKMAPESSVTNIQNQAVNEDYANSGYDRGHLAPVLHATSQSCSDATFTLTNAAPQNKSFNRGQWRVKEEAVAETLQKKCKGNSAYIVTGVVPGTDEMKSKERVLFGETSVLNPAVTDSVL